MLLLVLASVCWGGGLWLGGAPALATELPKRFCLFDASPSARFGVSEASTVRLQLKLRSLGLFTGALTL